MPGTQHQLLHVQLQIAQLQCHDLALALNQLRHWPAKQETALARRAQQRLQPQAKHVAIANLFARREHAPHKRCAIQGRLQPAQLGSRQHLLTGRVRQLFPALGKGPFTAKSHQLAIAPPGEIPQVLVFAPLRQNGLAVQRQLKQVPGITAIDATPASQGECQQPAPLGRVHAQAQAQWRLALQQPAQRLPRHPGISQRRHIAIGQLPAIGKAGGRRQAVAGLDQINRPPFPNQRVGRRQAHHSATDHRYPLLHRSSLFRLPCQTVPADQVGQLCAPSFRPWRTLRLSRLALPSCQVRVST
ncbi:hypothetical protein D9M73_139200 [compost metagenome]